MFFFLQHFYLFILAFLIRVFLVIFGLWQDSNMTVKYTDIDYAVFTDAGEFVLKNESPYKRSTFRYTPLLAIIMQLNHTLNYSFGKLFFCLCDLMVALISYLILKNCSKSNYRNVSLYLCTWLFNPLSLIISSRGSADSVIIVFVVLFLYFLTKPKLNCLDVCASGCFYGLAIHLKIYPVIYSLSLYFYINWRTANYKSRTSDMEKKSIVFFFKLQIDVVTTLYFLIICSNYGVEFIYETYLYHIFRKDIKHNFSPYFYLITRCFDNILLTIIIAFKYCKDVTFACFLQTCIFVTYNKVCTSQYFLWFLGLLPIIMGKIDISLKQASKLFFMWITGQVIWLTWAYFLEFQSLNTFLYVWMAGLLFFSINNYIIYEIIINYRQNNNKYLLV
ncbi:hypothetical protein HELRODRAFT_157380 [Helobdella robusta]|uniref:GPI alpha-1,4-mannosyltransferase I, catalytic subunit n=1 Tax=Helobdella robusta TaxID=6412 RepID=T1EMA6_HELRO|nr:hypothetical protein HELRODRAFT_157380 [Helobdella robusta]ESO00222.1 hypothetical protein HELRODRAFT_157380 [Helobdella robusta]